MPMFYTPKPRQFSYKPRFYDPEKERWEALKAKHALLNEAEELAKRQDSEEIAGRDTESVEQNAELEYFQRRVREIDEEQRAKERKLTWKDLFRKREMPKWNYQPRFGTESTEQRAESVESDRLSTGEHLAAFKKQRIKIKRRFDVTDTDYMKPIPAGRIMLYALLVCLLLYWILF